MLPYCLPSWAGQQAPIYLKYTMSQGPVPVPLARLPRRPQGRRFVPGGFRGSERTDGKVLLMRDGVVRKTRRHKNNCGNRWPESDAARLQTRNGGMPLLRKTRHCGGSEDERVGMASVAIKWPPWPRMGGIFPTPQIGNYARNQRTKPLSNLSHFFLVQMDFRDLDPGVYPTAGPYSNAPLQRTMGLCRGL